MKGPSTRWRFLRESLQHSLVALASGTVPGTWWTSHGMNEVASPNESNMVWYCWDSKEIQHVPWLQGIYRIVGDARDMRGLPHSRSGAVQLMRGECSVYRAVGTLGKSNLIWVDPTREERARAWIWDCIGSEVTKDIMHIMFVGQHEPPMEAETDLACIGTVGRTRSPWEAEGLHLSSPSHPDASAPSLAYSCTDHKLPFCKRTVALSPLSPLLIPCRGEGFTGVYLSD